MGNLEIEQVRDDYAAAVRAKDVDRFVSLYAADVRVFDLWERWSYDDAGAWRAMATEWFSSLGDELVAVEFEDVQIVTGESVGVMHAFVTYRGLSAVGTELRAMNNRLTWALRKTSDGWKIVHEHTSAPVASATGSVELRRVAG